jgi:hypothetical protein
MSGGRPTAPADSASLMWHDDVQSQELAETSGEGGEMRRIWDRWFTHCTMGPGNIVATCHRSSSR